MKGNMRKGTITRLILEKIAEFGETAVEGFFPRTRAETRLWRSILGLDKEYTFSLGTFSTLLSRLQRQGLVARSGAKRQARWRLTAAGKKILRESSIEPPKKDGIPRLVVFDIPEKDRKKRDRLRFELAACGYQRLQLSVWLGYAPLPASFIKTIEKLDLTDKVHIMSINKRGTLEVADEA